MNAGIVLDASVAVKLILNEPLSAQARALARATLQAHGPIYAPPLLPMEVLNALHRRARRHASGSLSLEDGGLSFGAAQERLRDFLAFEIELAFPPQLYQRALDLARTYDLPATYDALYLALAEHLDADLWTDDQRLLNPGAAGPIPGVRAIADYPAP